MASAFSFTSPSTSANPSIGSSVPSSCTASTSSSAAVLPLLSSTALTPSRRKRSFLWTYFTKLGEKEAHCDLCAMQIATAGNTTNMMKVYNIANLLSCVQVVN